MTIPRLLLYTRKDCCLCDEMKASVRAVGEKLPLHVEEIDVDTAPDLAARYGSEVPLLFIDGRKAFKYRVTASELKKKLTRNPI